MFRLSPDNNGEETSSCRQAVLPDIKYSHASMHCQGLTLARALLVVTRQSVSDCMHQLDDCFKGAFDNLSSDMHVSNATAWPEALSGEAHDS